MLQQLNSSYRQQLTDETLPSHDKHCLSNGMDQGFHNWLIYSGALRRVMKVKIFHQVDLLPLSSKVNISLGAGSYQQYWRLLSRPPSTPQIWSHVPMEYSQRRKRKSNYCQLERWSFTASPSTGSLHVCWSHGLLISSHSLGVFIQIYILIWRLFKGWLHDQETYYQPIYAWYISLRSLHRSR